MDPGIVIAEALVRVCPRVHALGLAGLLAVLGADIGVPPAPPRA